MAQAPTGPQFAIQPWALGLELLGYLASRGIGTYVQGATSGNSLFFPSMPDTPLACAALVPDASPAGWGLSYPHYTLYLRDEKLERMSSRATAAFEALHHQSPALASYYLYIECDGLPASFVWNANKYPMAVVGFRCTGMVKRA